MSLPVRERKICLIKMPVTTTMRRKEKQERKQERASKEAKEEEAKKLRIMEEDEEDMVALVNADDGDVSSAEQRTRAAVRVKVSVGRLSSPAHPKPRRFELDLS